jgi:hypothetical protein
VPPTQLRIASQEGHAAIEQDRKDFAQIWEAWDKSRQDLDI